MYTLSDFLIKNLCFDNDNSSHYSPSPPTTPTLHAGRALSWLARSLRSSV